LEVLTDRLAKVSVQPTRKYNLEWQEYLNLRNFLLVSKLIAKSALAREDSRGSHYRSDFPKPDDARFLQNICISADGRIQLRPVKTRGSSGSEGRREVPS
jgi:succinate dehydrogenase/fumarate reductase flavoprotein subunit